FVAANEGNISIRANADHVVCTPTMFCKGFMVPDDLCVVDMEGNQISGKRRRTSEVLLHLEIYRQRADINSVVHSHPPHATAFAVAREPIPNGVLPEPDIFLGEIPIAAYETPGKQDFADTIGPYVHRTHTIVLANHGTVTYHQELEKAYWFTEILDAYCRILILAKQVGRIEYLPISKVRELLALRKQWGFDDERSEDPASQQNVADFCQFREHWGLSKVAQRGFPAHPSSNEPETESLSNGQITLSDRQLEMLADLVAKRLKNDES
ncbi:MAG: class II aldolase/adducin family protein, partial [Planctomycetota bacterium]